MGFAFRNGDVGDSVVVVDDDQRSRRKIDVVGDERRCFWRLPAEEVRNSESSEKWILKCSCSCRGLTVMGVGWVGVACALCCSGNWRAQCTEKSTTGMGEIGESVSWAG